MLIRRTVDEFLSRCKVDAGLSLNTVAAYRSDLRHFLRKISCVTLNEAAAVETLKDYLVVMRTEEELAAATIRRRIACLRAFFSFCAANGDVQNPFDVWSPCLKPPQRLPRAMSGNEVGALWRAAGRGTSIDRETAFAILLMSATGIRVSELCSIAVRDVFSDVDGIHILGKGSRDRVVYVGDAALLMDIQHRRKKRLATSGAFAPLLVNSRGGALQAQTIRRRLHDVRRRAGITKSITPHMLRHTAATLLLETGTDIRYVQRLLGHASIATTELYTRVNDCALRRAIRSADALGLVRDHQVESQSASAV